MTTDLTALTDALAGEFSDLLGMMPVSRLLPAAKEFIAEHVAPLIAEAERKAAQRALLNVRDELNQVKNITPDEVQRALLWAVQSYRPAAAEDRSCHCSGATSSIGHAQHGAFGSRSHDPGSGPS